MFPPDSGSSPGTFSSRNGTACHNFTAVCKQNAELPASEQENKNKNAHFKHHRTQKNDPLSYRKDNLNSVISI